MNKLSERLEPYKKAVIESFDTDWEYDYDYILDYFVVVEPDVLQTDERVLDEDEMMSLLSEGTKKKVDFDDSGIMIEYVKLGELISPLDRNELIDGLMNKHAIRDLEMKYSYSLHLEEKIRRELSNMEVQDIYELAYLNDHLVVHPSSGEIEFDCGESEGQDDCDCYNLESFISRGTSFNVPERNIFGGFQFHEAPIQYVTDEEYAEWRIDQEEYEEYQSEQGEQGDFEPGDDFPF